MTKRKKRNAITLVSLLLALSALIGLYVWYGNKTAATDDSQETENITLATLDTAKVTDIHYIGSDVDINLTLTEGNWTSKEEPERPINQDNVNSMLSVISEINAYQTVVKSPDNLSEYGLDSPYAYIQATLEDGSTVKLLLGDEIITAEGYYAMVNDDPAVYLVTINYGSGLHLNNFDLTEIEKAPEITAQNITYLSVDNRDNEDVELKYNDKATLDNSGSSLYTWQVLKPYDNGYSADSSLIATLAANYTTFDFLDCVDYKGDDLSKYGLDQPTATINIGYFVETSAASTTPSTDSSTALTTEASTTKTDKEYKIYIGDKNDDGDYYVKSEGSHMVYTLSASTVDTMLKVDVFSLINPYVCIPNIDNVDRITAEFAGKEYNLGITRTTEANDSGEEETKATYSFNGKTAIEDQFKELYQKMISSKYDAEMKEEVDTSTIDPVLTLNFHIFGDEEKTINASFLPYNDSFYIVDKGTGRYFLVDKRTIDDLASAISLFKAD